MSKAVNQRGFQRSPRFSLPLRQQLRDLTRSIDEKPRDRLNVRFCRVMIPPSRKARP
jgi:hypothetical protein